MQPLESTAKAADRAGVSGRLRGQSGFGLIELLMAMVMLNIGLLAVVAAFTSGIWGLARAGSVSTAAAIGDAQLELFRGLPNACVYNTSPPSSGVYAGDSAYSNQYQVTTVGTCASTPPTNGTTPSRTMVGPDHHKYEVDTYINYRCTDMSMPTGAAPGTCPINTPKVTLVTVVVRDGISTAKVLGRQSSMFDPLSG
jgi:type II secretory pathway pseudopilin PulG